MVTTTIEEWGVVPDYIGDGSGDQEEIMMAICDSIGEGYDGMDCDGVVTGTPEASTTMRLCIVMPDRVTFLQQEQLLKCRHGAPSHRIIQVNNPPTVSRFIVFVFSGCDTAR